MQSYFQVTLKILSSDKFVMCDNRLKERPRHWLRDQSANPAIQATSDQQIFNLRKVTDKLFILDIQGDIVGTQAFGSFHYLIGLTGTANPADIVGGVFQFLPRSFTSNQFHIKASNGFLLQPSLLQPTQSDPHRCISPDLEYTEEWGNGNGIFEVTLLPNPTEGTIYAALSNIRLLDGVKVEFLQPWTKKYLSAKSGTGVAANSLAASNTEIFKLWAIPNTKKHLIQASNGLFLGLNGQTLVAVSGQPRATEEFEIIQKNDDFTRIRIRTSNGNCLEANEEKPVTATSPINFKGLPDHWGENALSGFLLRIIGVDVPDKATKIAIEKLTPPTPVAPIKLGPWGYNCGKDWDADNISSSTNLTEVVISHGDVVNSIAFKYTTDGNVHQCTTKGGAGRIVTKITLGKGEYIQTFSGFYTSSGVSSLTFFTNKSNAYGPCGKEIGTPFTVPLTNGKIVGFYGNAGDVLNSIGCYLAQV